MRFQIFIMTFLLFRKKEMTLVLLFLIDMSDLP